MLTVGSLFSGIGGMDLGLERAGMRVEWQVEIDDYARRVLTKHWPHVPKYGDITTIDWATVPRVDVLCGGFPCQDLSYAGKRAGLREGTRSGLWFHYLRAIRALRPRYILVENVPGLLSSNYTIGPYRCLCGWTPRRGGMLISRQKPQEFFSENRCGHVGQNRTASYGIDEVLWRDNTTDQAENGEVGTGGMLDNYRRASHRLLKACREASQGKAGSSRSTHLAVQGCDSEEQPHQLGRNNRYGSVGTGPNQGIESERPDCCPSCGRYLQDIPAQYGSALGRVLGDLAESGYDAEWDCLPASAVGAPHRRDRVWIVAYHAEIGQEGNHQPAGGTECAEERIFPKSLGGHPTRQNTDVANPQKNGNHQRIITHPTKEQAFWVNQYGEYGRRFAITDFWKVEPAVGRVVDGVSNRLDRIGALGNAVVPQIVEALGRMILAADCDPKMSQPCQNATGKGGDRQ